MKKNILSIVLLLSISFTVFSQAKFKEPILITSAGQSADVKLAKLLAKKQGLNAETKLMAKDADLSGVKTLIIVPGFSSKGLGAAGISQEDEMNRVKALIKKANSLNIPIVMMHIGGLARRGGQSDGFCKLSAESSKSMIVVKQGNQDSFFTKIAKTKNISIELVERISNAAVPMGKLFK
ncbi:MAG: DUF6305 family protein [Bacteroidota bacterium]